MALLFNSEEMKRHLPNNYKDTEPGWAYFGAKDRNVEPKMRKNWQQIPDLHYRKRLELEMERKHAEAMRRRAVWQEKRKENKEKSSKREISNGCCVM